MNGIFKKYTKVYFFTCLSVIMVVAAVNFFVDPANIFGNNDYEKAIAMLLVEGKNVANITNCDERLVQKIYINNIRMPLEVVVLGSSRSLTICSQDFPGRSLFNNSVSGASIEDYLATYELYWVRGFVPKIVIIGTDPWLLNKNNDQKRWKSLKEYYLSMAARLHLKPGLLASASANSSLQQDKIEQLINFEYFMKSINYERHDRHIYPTVEQEADVSIKRADGSISYDKAFREMSPLQTIQAATEYAWTNPVYSLGGFKELDPDIQETLERFIDLLKKSGIEVILFLAPYHPVTYEILMQREEYANILPRAEAYFRDLAQRKGLRLVGSYNPHGWCAPEEFYDGMHPRKTCMARLFSHWSADSKEPAH